jgi:hypothetical protein
MALTQEPPGCNTKTTQTRKHLKTVSTQRSQTKSKTPKRRVLDLRSNKTTKRSTPKVSSENYPVIASPIFVPQDNGGGGTAITSSNGYLYIVMDKKLYKISERTLKTIQVTQLGRSFDEPAVRTSPTPKRRSVVASKEQSPTPRKATKSRKAD